MKDLPRVFANPIDRSINNNRSYSYGKLENQKPARDERQVLEKIDKLFKNDSTAYSIDCIIKFENNEEKYTIIGKTNNNLVTKTQKLIPIREIFDIELAQ